MWVSSWHGMDCDGFKMSTWLGWTTFLYMVAGYVGDESGNCQSSLSLAGSPRPLTFQCSLQIFFSCILRLPLHMYWNVYEALLPFLQILFSLCSLNCIIFTDLCSSSLMLSSAFSNLMRPSTTFCWSKQVIRPVQIQGRGNKRHFSFF